MSQKYCPECGNQLPEGSKFCYHCGKKLPVEASSSDATAEVGSDASASGQSAAASTSATTAAPKPNRPVRKAKKKKKKNYHIGYLIFLAILLGIMFWLIHKKATLPEEKPMKSLPSERPQQYRDYTLIDSLGENDTIYAEEISLLSPELPKLHIKEPLPTRTDNIEDWRSDDDDYDDVEPTYSAPASPPPAPTPIPPVSLKTEQSVRNMLISNRFVDPTTTDILTFTNNGNVMMKNGDALTTEMEVHEISGNKAVMYFYDESNNSWDVSLDVSGPHKRLQLMDQEFSSDN